MSARTAWLLAVAFAAIAAAFIWIGIERPVWLDEANTVQVAERGMAGISGALRSENNLPLYYFILSFWINLFGDSEIALRLLSGFFYAAGVAVAFVLGREALRSRHGAWFSAFFYLCSMQAVSQAQNIRMYAFLGMVSGLSAWAFFRLFGEKRAAKADWAVWIAWNAIGLLTHVWFVFIPAAQFLALAMWRRAELGKFFAAGCAAAVPFLLFWGRGFYDQLHNGATNWMPPFQFWFVPDALLTFFGGAAALALYLAAAAFVLADRPAASRWFLRPEVRTLAAVFFFSLALPLAVCVVKPIYAPNRYTVIALAPLAVLFGGVFANLAPRRAAVAICAALLVLVLAARFRGRDTVPEAQLPEGQSDRTTADYVVRNAAEGDAIVFTSLTRAAADYYFRRRQATGRFVEISYPPEYARHLSWADSNRMLQDPAKLNREASETVERLVAMARDGKAVWVYFGYDPRVAAVLKRKLDNALRLDRRVDLSGPYHTRLLVYRGAK